MIDTCSKKHGFPLHLSKGNAVSNYTVADEILDDDGSNSIIQEDENENPNKLAFTPEQHRGLLTLLHKSTLSHNTNHITTSQTANLCVLLLTMVSVNHGSWILGLLTIYVIHCPIFTAYKKIKPRYVKLPDGSQIHTNIAGNISFQKTYILLMCCTSLYLLSTNRVFSR